ncbi:MAG: hypothetical protein ACOC7N_02360 [Chloroflexota bacterium]
MQIKLINERRREEADVTRRWIRFVVLGVIAGALLSGCGQTAEPSDVVFEEGFETGLQDWEKGSDVPEDPNHPGQPVAWSIETSEEQASEGEKSALFVLDGVADDGTIWLTRSFDGAPNEGFTVDLAFDFWSASESFNTLAYVAAYAGDSPPTGEADFDLGQPANLAEGWKAYTYSFDVESADSGEVWVAFGISVVWETEVTYYVDNVRVEITPR